ncbi:hypothetical protein IU487_20945 [Nocardia puris]|uniref:esterase/lipase family protein n=1 Tax=Nocardia puris TaxID=208602 RepID=UPI000A77E4E2|nr:hypothetical protein [Nocardia puris]MBF6213488.1 hypothetical protein [Nocardia puris]
MTSSQLLADGRCVYGLEYDSLQPVTASVDYFTHAAERILALNGVGTLDLVGKSQGGLIARAVSLRLAEGTAGSARQVVSIFGPQHGIRTVVAGRDVTGAIAGVLPVVFPERRGPGRYGGGLSVPDRAQQWPDDSGRRALHHDRHP